MSWWNWWFPSVLRRQRQGSSPFGSDAAGSTYANKSASPESALQLSTAWACVRLNARTIGALPRKVYLGSKANGERRAADHPLDVILHESPNADQTAMEFWEGQTTSLNLRGNAYAEKDFGTLSGKLVGLTPFPTDDVRVYRADDGSRRYKVSGTGSRVNDFGEDRVFHLRGFGSGGLTGLSPLEFGRQTIASATAADESAARAFDSGLQLAGFIETEREVKYKDGQRDELVELFDRFGQSKRPGKFMPLDPGMKFTPLGMKPQDVQLLESRGFNIEEICRWFGVPPILVGHASAGQTMWGSGVEQIMLAWLALSLHAELERIEQSIEKQLLTPEERRKLFVEHNVDALLRSDATGRAALMSVQAQNGLRTRDELRAIDNLGPLPGGDFLTVQANMMRLDTMGDDAGGSSDQQARASIQNWLFGGDPQAVIAEAIATALKAHTGPAMPALPAPKAE